MSWRTHATPPPNDKPRKVVTIDVMPKELEGRRWFNAYCEEHPELETTADTAAEAAALMRHKVQNMYPDHHVEALLNGDF